ncbi:MAG: HupE/UreJ family protein [Chitinophagaceae bacterium]|nr:HupE/UreJ family protein [Chitinophagaceae bacterium]
MSISFKKISLFSALLFCAPVLFAHSINYSLENAPAQDVVWYYLKLGFQHIIPSGADHILFVIGLCLLSTNLKTILWQATAFTVAHSITLALSMKNILMAPSGLIEPIIALSIMFVAVENMMVKKLSPWRILIVFMFGLIHGMGFASALSETGLPPGKFFTSVLAFNAGVELGQVTVILAMFALIVNRFKHRPWYRRQVLYGLSGLITLIAFYWTIERVFYS